MATVNRLNKISQVLRQHKGYRNNLVLTSTLLSLLSLPAFAADEDKIESAEEIEVIEVQGLRQTMTKSLNRKKNSVAIVDAVVAADFGELLMGCPFLMLLKIFQVRLAID
ncbi:hypothetical protein [Psychrosphaera algicola]|uniref:TonB-dependent receptor plug domain-containing protein n=1 Tax=Psychrosphaera algicola TaxID=3023714 RepID=A0ABT5FJ66_9GAMM|nr:hypothetical protein [Psychrosphaera sp. G1-22]MDC2891190.1 hypothetical protein [Psychrosphaera sp. G1-22]